MEFLSLSRRRSSARNVPIGEERGETDVFAGYENSSMASSFSLLSSYDLEKDPDRFLAVLNFKEFKCGEDPRC